MININDYTYTLPEERIALYPLAERDLSKLLVYRNGAISHSNFSKLTDFVPADSILFFNNTRVIPARMIFKKETGAEIEIFLLDPLWPSPIVSLAMSASQKCRWRCMIGNLKRWGDHSKLNIARGELLVEVTLVDRHENIVEFSWSTPIPFSDVVQKIGVVPLPPYIRRQANNDDRERYQTVYSREDGAVAAPTAGLHFTEKVFQSLREKGVAFDYLTLHVSAGTFQPVKEPNALDHTMHEEQVIVTRGNIENLLKGRLTVAVGTTSLRTLESVYWYGVKLTMDPRAVFSVDQNEAYQLKPVHRKEALAAILKKMNEENAHQLGGRTSIYILPGYEFKMVDALITNFHQPGSTLMLLVAAFVGHDWKRIYEEALANDYRFLSYGDSSILYPAKA